MCFSGHMKGMVLIRKDIGKDRLKDVFNLLKVSSWYSVDNSINIY